MINHPYLIVVLIKDLISVVSFNVVDTVEMRKEFTGKRLGLIRPKLAWATEKLN